jgi:hypothetical protein
MTSLPSTLHQHGGLSSHGKDAGSPGPNQAPHRPAKFTPTPGSAGILAGRAPDEPVRRAILTANAHRLCGFAGDPAAVQEKTEVNARKE